MMKSLSRRKSRSSSPPGICAVARSSRGFIS
jgi:hypothetical protein